VATGPQNTQWGRGPRAHGGPPQLWVKWRSSYRSVYIGRKMKFCEKHETIVLGGYINWMKMRILKKSIQILLNQGIKCPDEICNLMWVNIYIPGGVMQNSISYRQREAFNSNLDCTYLHPMWQAFNGRQEPPDSVFNCTKTLRNVSLSLFAAQ